jgi:hypothetical protein
MKRKDLFFKVAALLVVFAAVIATSSCRSMYVREAQVSPFPMSEGADLGGVRKETIDYFRDVYPPEYWKPASDRSRMAIGPILINRQALTLLEGDSAEKVSAEAKTGDSKATVVVENRHGDPRFLFAENYSHQSQAVVLETIAQAQTFDVFALGQEAAIDLYEGNQTYGDLLDQGILYYVNGNMSREQGERGGYQVYLRLLDTATKKVICAVSSKGTSLEDASRQAASALLKRCTGAN